MPPLPENNEWLIPDLTAKLKPLGFKLFHPRQGFYHYRDERGNKATLCLGVIGAELIYLSGPSVILENHAVHDFLNDLHKKGCRKDTGSFFARRLPQFDDNKNVRWAFKFDDKDQNDATFKDLLHYIETVVVPLIVRWGSYSLTKEDIELLRNENDAEYSLVVNLFLAGQKVEAESLAREYLAKSDNKEMYQKFIKELFESKPKLLLGGPTK